MTPANSTVLLELAAGIADEEAQKHRAIAASCQAWSPAQAEHLRAKDCAMNIADRIRVLAAQAPEVAS